MKLPRTSRPVVGLLVAFLVAFLVVLGIPAAAAAAVPENVPENVPVVTYDAGQAAEFRDAVDAGANVWNENVQNLRLEPATGGAADVVVLADDGWPRAEVIGLGQGRVWMGRQAVNEGHDTIRIAAHELGHLLGLPDNRTGECEDLMSGASAGPDCDNAKPNPDEIAEVERNFAGGVRIAPQVFREDVLAAR